MREGLSPRGFAYGRIVSRRSRSCERHVDAGPDHDRLHALNASASRPSILLIEDEAHAREAMALLLDYYGYDVTVASNGTEALALVTDVSPDLVVTDWRMPGLSGRALCIALRERRRTMPIIVVTSAEEVFDHDQPVNARLRKPVDPPLLNHVIAQEILGMSARQRF